MTTLDTLPVFRDCTSHRASSYDVSGGNADAWTIAPGERRVLADIEGAGCVRHIWMTLAMPDDDYLRRIVLRCTWDDASEPSVEVPIGDFFGMGHAKRKNFVTAPFTDTHAVAREIAAVGALGKKPIVCNFMTDLSQERYRITMRILKEGGVPFYANPTAAARALGALARYGRLRRRDIGLPESSPGVDAARAASIVEQARKSGRSVLPAADVYDLAAVSDRRYRLKSAASKPLPADLEGARA